MDGVPILGCPTGTADFRRTYVADAINTATSSLLALSHLQPWSAWRLLRTCICARPGYLARVLEPADMDESFTIVDEWHCPIDSP